MITEMAKCIIQPIIQTMLYMLITLVQLDIVIARRSEVVRIAGSFCGAVLGDVSGAEIRSSHYPILSSCTVTLDAARNIHFPTPNFIIAFDVINIKDCDVTLSLYDSANASGTLLTQVTCHSPFPPDTFTSTRYLTIVLENQKLHRGFSFRFSVTGYTKDKCNNFQCLNGFCIDADLVCDKIQHCPDGSDESYYYPADCSSWSHVSSTAYNILRVGVGAVVGLVATVTLTCVVVSVIFLIWYRRKVTVYRQLLQTNYSGDSTEMIDDEDDTSQSDEQTLMYPYPCSASGPPTYCMDSITDYGSTTLNSLVEETEFNGCKV